MRIHYTRQIYKDVARAINPKGKYWPFDTLFTYSFIGGSMFQRDYVRKGIQRILDEVPGLRIVEEMGDNPGLIRISFNVADGSWSYVGTDCLAVSSWLPTMNIGWYDQEEQSNVVHEWLHALNFSHEHIRGINFDKPKVYAAFKEIGWGKSEVDNNLFHYQEHHYDETPMDVDSIMKYYIPCEWTVDGENCGYQNKVLSIGDINRLREMFPDQKLKDLKAYTINNIIKKLNENT